MTIDISMTLTDNPKAEASRIFYELSDWIEENGIPEDGLVLRDSNGNQAGEMKVE